ncbi:MAG: c-type cytochrome [Proteobacteria bacterium]|jgi:cytochrome c|nr:cytochrome C [Methylibium sp.]MCH8855084.1 c-type cytochrome [Pseudomonadota bacterium]|mmetsp:Transcript_59448/g.140633  ORF Transcript_59448/g.140633 Transcript_59448/m.140633 type:complete len:123 (-) Transcript_59448:741-1109(-)
MKPLLMLVALFAAIPLAQASDAVRGQALYQARCAACHALDHHGVGPAHRGVFGRLAGTAKGYAGYSAALRNSGLTWTETTLDRWLVDPEALVPGQVMGISLPDAAERADVIAFLRTLAKPKE